VESHNEKRCHPEQGGAAPKDLRTYGLLSSNQMRRSFDSRWSLRMTETDILRMYRRNTAIFNFLFSIKKDEV